MATIKEIKSCISNVRTELTQKLFTLRFATPKWMTGKQLQEQRHKVNAYREQLEELLFSLDLLEGDLELAYGKDEYERYVEGVDDIEPSLDGEFCKLVRCMSFEDGEFWLIYLAYPYKL